MDPIRSIVVVGGGTAGWMAATYLSRQLGHLRPEITVVESSAIGTVGVGEATVPAIRDFFAAVGLTDAEVLRETEGTIKYGIRFDGWNAPGHRFFHPFGLYGVPARGVTFHHYWLKLRQAGDPKPLAAYCLAAQLAEQGRCLEPARQPPNDLGVFDFAVHFDASRFAALLRRRAIAAGVTQVDARIEGVERDAITGDVGAVVLDDGRRIGGELWIDCSGFRSLLLGEALGVPYVDWRRWLPVDRAIAVPCRPRDAAPEPFTIATARPAGWQWRIPLRHRIGNGYVYCSDFVDDASAETTLLEGLEGEPLAEPNRLRFTTGHRARFWDHNVVGLGLASGFLEPLESTSISLIQTGLERLVRFFPTRGCDPRLATIYNYQSVLEFERLRDFLLLHYQANGRRGEPFWDHVRATLPTEGLQLKLDTWRASGEFVRREWETFQDPSWLSLYAGFEDLPERPSPLADQFTTAELTATLARMRAAIDATVAQAEPHAAYLARMVGEGSPSTR
jgi:tryptophan halogenase